MITSRRREKQDMQHQIVMTKNKQQMAMSSKLSVEEGIFFFFFDVVIDAQNCYNSKINEIQTTGQYHMHYRWITTSCCQIMNLEHLFKVFFASVFSTFCTVVLLNPKM